MLMKVVSAKDDKKSLIIVLVSFPSIGLVTVILWMKIISKYKKLIIQPTFYSNVDIKILKNSIVLKQYAHFYSKHDGYKNDCLM